MSAGQNDDTVYYDTEEYMRDEDEKKGKPNDKREDGGKGRSDAKPDDKRQNDGIDLPDAIHGIDEYDQSVASFRINLPPVEGVPHCDDCVVMFASMSGKCLYCVC